MNTLPANLTEAKLKPSREFVLMAESDLGERANGSRYFATQHPTFTSIKDAEIFGFKKIKQVRWLVGEKIDRPGLAPIYNFVSKPVTPRRG